MSNPTYEQFKAESYELLAEACQLLTSGVYLNGYLPSVGKPNYDKALQLMLEAGVMPPNEQHKRFDGPTGVNALQGE